MSGATETQLYHFLRGCGDVASPGALPANEEGIEFQTSAPVGTKVRLVEVRFTDCPPLIECFVDNLPTTDTDILRLLNGVHQEATFAAFSDSSITLG